MVEICMVILPILDIELLIANYKHHVNYRNSTRSSKNMVKMEGNISENIL